MKRNLLIASMISLSSILGAFAAPNVIIFYVDDMGIGDLGCYGCKDIRTPHLDDLAGEGVRFTNYYSAAPICSPSRAALLTGRYPIRAGMPSMASSMPGVAGMPSDEVTVAELAKSRGYATGAIGKWHLGFSHDTQPNSQGFDEFFGHHAGCIDYYSHMFYWQDPPHHDLYRNREEVHEEGQYMTDLIAREAIRFITTHAEKAKPHGSGEPGGPPPGGPPARGRAGSPFLLYCAFNAPHYAMQAPQSFRDMYKHLPPERAIYAAMVTAMDDALGKIIDTLQQAGLTDETFVFFASDNGATTELRANGKGGSNAPYRCHKFSLFDGGIHLPAIVRWPGQAPRGQVRDQLVCGIDLFPTVAEIISAPLPEDRKIDGMSLVPVLKDANAPGHDVLFWKQGDQEAVHQGRWKLVVNGVQTVEGGGREPLTSEDTLFLTDLQADPGEKHNLRREHPEKVQQLQKLLADWHEDLLASRPAPSRVHRGAAGPGDQPAREKKAQRKAGKRLQPTAAGE